MALQAPFVDVARLCCHPVLCSFGHSTASSFLLWAAALPDLLDLAPAGILSSEMRKQKGQGTSGWLPGAALIRTQVQLPSIA